MSLKGVLSAGVELLLFPMLIFRSPPEGEPKKILVMEPWGIGDLILATGALTDIRHNWPNAKIDVLSRSYAPTILKGHPSKVNAVCAELPWTQSLTGKYRIWRWKWRELWSLIRRLRDARYDLVVECRGDVRNHVIMVLSGARIRAGLRAAQGILLTHKPNHKPLTIGHRLDDWRAVCHELGIEPVSTPSLSVPETVQGSIANRLGLKVGGWLGIHVGAKNFAKRWPMAEFERFLNELDRTENPGPIVLFCEPDDDLSEIQIPEDIVMATEISLEELIAAIANCRKFVCCDGGAMHIAAALSVPVVALFGPTSAKWFGPVGKGHTLLQKDVCSYRPCFDICRFPSPICMEAISVNDLLKSME